VPSLLLVVFTEALELAVAKIEAKAAA